MKCFYAYCLVKNIVALAQKKSLVSELELLTSIKLKAKPDLLN